MNALLRQPSILIIDDDEMTRMACRKILSQVGYHIFEAENGAVGLQLYKQYIPPVVVTDILMPEVEGLQTIRDIIAQKKPVRIIAMSNGGSTRNMSFLHLAQHVGASCIMEKPVKPKELIGAIRTQLSAKAV